jgi:hypothetical protein
MMMMMMMMIIIIIIIIISKMHGPSSDVYSRWSRNFPSFMETKISLTCAQMPVTESCPYPDESRPHPHILLV